MRDYREELEVKVDSAGRPVAFRWRGRHYRVREYLEHWQARTSWWQQEPGAQPLCLEHPMWRVEAVSGARSGVFEIRGGSPVWTLVGLVD